MRHEDQMLRAVIRWARKLSVVVPDLALLYHTPNEGKRSAREGARAKAEGLSPGIPDLHLPVARNGFHGLWIELKTKVGKVSENQRRWLHALTEQGHYATVCRSELETRRTIESYLKGELR